MPYPLGHGDYCYEGLFIINKWKVLIMKSFHLSWKWVLSLCSNNTVLLTNLKFTALEINVVSYHGLAVWPQENVYSATGKRNGRHIHQKRVATTTSLNAEHISCLPIAALHSADSIWGPNCIICWVDIYVLLWVS